MLLSLDSGLHSGFIQVHISSHALKLLGHLGHASLHNTCTQLFSLLMNLTSSSSNCYRETACIVCDALQANAGAVKLMYASKMSASM